MVVGVVVGARVVVGLRVEVGLGVVDPIVGGQVVEAGVGEVASFVVVSSSKTTPRILKYK